MLELKEALSIIILFILVVGIAFFPIYFYNKKNPDSRFFTVFWILLVLVVTGFILRFFMLDFDAMENPESATEYYKEEDRELKQLYPADIDNDDYIARDMNGDIVKITKSLKQNSIKFKDAEMNPNKYHIVKYTYDLYKGPLTVYKTEYRLVPK